MRILFISWDGPHVSYLEGLFLPIFADLRKSGYEFHIMHFSWADSASIASVAAACHSRGIPYQHVPVQTWPHPVVGKLWTLWKGQQVVRRYMEKHDIGWVMPRTMMPAQMVLNVVKRKPELRIIFDADGLPIEERVDFAGLRPGGLRYRKLKAIERDIIRAASLVLTRSNQAIEILVGQYAMREKFYKVINGRDETLFRVKKPTEIQELRNKLGIAKNTFVTVYAGSLGKPYCVGEILQFQKLIQQRRADALLLVLTGNPAYFRTMPLPQMIVLKVNPAQMPEYLSLANVALGLRRQALSMKGVAPVKLGEYLLVGIPVIASSRIGDTDEILSGKPFCYLLNDLTPSSLERAADWAANLAPSSSLGARECGIEYFGLESAIQTYERALAGIKSK